MRLAPLMPLVLLGLAAGCASTPVKKQDVPALARADALVLDVKTKLDRVVKPAVIELWRL